jgi:hypothetical protein
MNNYLVENVNEFSAGSMQNQTFLVIHKLHRTPYHIGILFGEKYYALTVKGPEIKPRAEMEEILLNKAVNNLMIEIKHLNKGIDADVYFNRVSLNHTDFLSCLFPVKNLVAELTSNNKFNEANNLFEFLDILKEYNLAGNILATRMTPIMESKIVLMGYDTESIKRHIKKLQEKSDLEQNKEHTSQ